MRESDKGLIEIGSEFFEDDISGERYEDFKREH